MISVSIVVPMYNSARYIEKCASSLFGQSLQNIQYIFVDDASTDDTIAVLEKTLKCFPSREKSVLIIKNKHNVGASQSRKNALRHVEGEYVICCDSDDWMDLDMCTSMLMCAHTHNSDIIVCDSIYEEKGGERKVSYTIDDIDTMMSLLISRNSSICCSLCCMLVRATLIKQVYFPFKSMMEDFVITLQLLHKKPVVTHVGRALYHYLQHEDSMCNNMSYDRIVSRFQEAKENSDYAIFLLSQWGLSSCYSGEIAKLKYIVKSFLIPLLQSPQYYRQVYPLWKQTYRKDNIAIVTCRYIPIVQRIIFAVVMCGFYPIYMKIIN